ncbi:hypothetical protein Tco_1062322, partial [Tanacetum coccineum]
LISLSCFIFVFSKSGVFVSKSGLSVQAGAGPKTSATLKIRPGYTSYDNYIRHQLEKTTNPKLRKIWTTRDWERKIHVFTQFFSDLKHKKLISNESKALCVGARVGQEVEALKRVGGGLNGG